MVELRAFEPGDLPGVLRLCEAEGWPSFPADPARALRILTAPGVTTVVAVDGGVVAGFAELFSDGELQAFVLLLADHGDGKPFDLLNPEQALYEANGAALLEAVAEGAPLDNETTKDIKAEVAAQK
jgi:hypothetical protein